MAVACRWCGSDVVRIGRDPLSVLGETTYRFAQCRRCRVKSAIPWSTAGLNYTDVQREHFGYALHEADHAYVATLLRRGPESLWAEIAADHLANKTFDRRYRAALGIGLAAYRRSHRLRILEVGCNFGFVGGVLSRLGHRYTGLDVQEDALNTARSIYAGEFVKASVEEYAQAHPAERFDVILGLDVIEHVLAPRQFLDACLGLLVTGGELLLTTPDGDQMLDDEWGSDLPPLHLTILSRKAFALIPRDVARVRISNEPATSPSLRAALRRLGVRRPRRLIKRTPPQRRSPPIVSPTSPDYCYAASRNTWSGIADEPDAIGARWVRGVGAMATGILALCGIVVVDRTMIVRVTKSVQ